MQDYRKQRIPGLTSLIILTSDQFADTKKCIKSIRMNTPEPNEIIAVDNGSSHKATNWFHKRIREDPAFKLIKVKSDSGQASACNQAIAESSGEYILILHDDVAVSQGWLSDMLACLNRVPDAGIIGPMTINVDGPQMVITTDYNSPEHLDRYAKAFREKNRYRRIPLWKLDSCCILFRHELFEKVGLFDERFDSPAVAVEDYCLRAFLEGYSNYIAGDVFIHHYGSRSCIGSRINFASAMDKNRKIFLQKWTGVDENSPIGIKYKTFNALSTADHLNQSGLMENAVGVLIEGIKMNPDDPRLHFKLVEILIENKKYQEANQILENMPENLREGPIWFESIALCKGGLQMNEEAGWYADKALALNGTSSKALNLKGILAFKKGLRADAEKFFQMSLESDRGFGEPYANIGALRWPDNKEEAFALFERAFTLSPMVESVVRNYYNVAADLSRLERAETVFREAIAAYPSNKRLKYSLVDILIQQKKHGEAMNAMEEAMITFGINEKILAAALELRDKVGPKTIESAPSTARSLESLNPDSISLCMIVKNEESKIGHCIWKIKPAVDEIIVVDTGSSDRTKDIAKAFGAKVYDFAWNDDFADARNFSLSKACCRWILTLDADEVISFSDHKSLKELLKTARSEPKAYSFVTRNYVHSMNVMNWAANDGKYGKEEKGAGWFPGEKVRLFPSGARFRFEYPVHERVEPSLVRGGIKIVKCGIPVHHYGKLDEEKTASKAERYYELAKRKVNEMEKPDEKILHEMAVQAGVLGKYEEALEYLKKVIALNPNYAPAYQSMGNNYYNLQRYEEALSSYKTSMQLDPDIRDAVLMRSTLEIITGNAEDAVQYLEGLLKRNAEFTPAVAALATAYFCLGRKNKGMELLRKQESNFNFAQYASRMSEILLKSNRVTYANALLESVQEI